jgi:hypothetical protein
VGGGAVLHEYPLFAVLEADLAPGARAVLDSRVMYSSSSQFLHSPGAVRLGMLALQLRR